MDLIDTTKNQRSCNQKWKRNVPFLGCNEENTFCKVFNREDTNLISGDTEIGDFSNNKYAAAMKELANGLVGWSGLLLIPFLIYQIILNKSALVFSLKSFGIVLACEVVFVVLARLGNAVFAAITLPFVVPFSMKGKITIAQNVQMSLLVIFGLSLCVFCIGE